MSVYVTSLVTKSSVPFPQRYILLALADYANDDGVCWPAVATLAEWGQVGESTVRRNLRPLAELGVLSIRKRPDQSSVYTIDLDRLRALPRPTRSDRGQSERGKQSGRRKEVPPEVNTTDQSQNDCPAQSDTSEQIGDAPPPDSSGTPSQIGTQTVKEPPVEPSGAARKRAHRIPDDFTVTDAMIEWARSNTPLVGRAETDQFLDYWRAASGTTAVKKDWVAAWRFWMRRAQGDAERRNGGGRHLQAVPSPLPDVSNPDAALAELRERASGDGPTAVGREVGKLIHVVFLPEGRTPNDRVSELEWNRRQVRAFIDKHEDEIRAALIARQAG